jgi:hypothetical protein
MKEYWYVNNNFVGRPVLVNAGVSVEETDYLSKLLWKEMPLTLANNLLLLFFWMKIKTKIPYKILVRLLTKKGNIKQTEYLINKRFLFYKKWESKQDVNYFIEKTFINSSINRILNFIINGRKNKSIIKEQSDDN